MPNSDKKGKVRYAVVGLGYISQIAVLPAFENARSNSVLGALVSDDPEKLRKLSKKYDVPSTASYDEYDELLESGAIDAVYIALPNHLHADYSIRAANAGIHVLCEKPMAVRADECRAMIDAARNANVRLMIAYRLHFESANLTAVDLVQSGKIGDPRYFESTFSMQVKEDNIRVMDEKLGGGPVYDLGIYCINAARYLFRSEPFEVFAYSATRDTERFKEASEMVSVLMRFPDERLASFTCSFGAADTSALRVVGTEGDLRLEPAFEHKQGLKHYLTRKGKTRDREFKHRDQFAPELLEFSKCVLNGTDPEPSGEEGLIDVQIIEAIMESIRTERPVRIETASKEMRPDKDQSMKKPPVEEEDLVNAEAPSRK